ncbi:MAG: hypothetical protein IPM67_08530 [Sphingomonadales bacterium]|jgi:hypothetical protein|nr:hypothetical protein [Sphingomonadales bacterium]MBK9268682.1 hypothetical protein [Sphingomonadales bacterium]
MWQAKIKAAQSKLDGLIDENSSKPCRYAFSQVVRGLIPLNHGHSAMNLFSPRKMTQSGAFATILCLG